MGDRVSISFKNKDEESVALFSHWGGMSFVEIAQQYAADLKKSKEGKTLMPLDRLEPQTVMVDFIRYLFKEIVSTDEVESNYYLGKDKDSGDNGDNGHFTIELGVG